MEEDSAPGLTKAEICGRYTMRSFFLVFSTVALLAATSTFSFAQVRSTDVPEYIALRASLASLYGLELGKWVEAFGTKEQSTHEALLRTLAKSLDHPLADSIGKARSRDEAAAAYIIESQAAAYGFRLGRVEFVYLAYMLGNCVGQVEVFAGRKANFSTDRTAMDKPLEVIVLMIEAMNMDALTKADLQIHLQTLRGARNRKEIEVGAESLVRWHTLFLMSIAPPSRPDYDLVRRLQAGVLMADLKALEWGFQLGSGRSADSPEIAKIRRYFGIRAPSMEDLGVRDAVDAMLAEQLRYYDLGKTAGRLLAFRGQETSAEKLAKPVETQMRDAVLRQLADVRAKALRVSAPENLIKPLDRTDREVKSATTLAELLKGLDDGVLQWYSEIVKHLVAGV
jgi:hypothetical protein